MKGRSVPRIQAPAVYAAREPVPIDRRLRAGQMVDDAMGAHKLGRSQRSWALKYAAEEPTGFAKIMKLTPDYNADALLAFTEVFTEQLRVAKERRAGRDTGPGLAALILRMQSLAGQMSRAIDDGLLPPDRVAERDDLLKEAKRLAAPLSDVRVDPLAKGRGGRRKISRDAARRELLQRYILWRRAHPLTDRLTNRSLAKVTPRCDEDKVADDLTRADWKLDDVEVAFERARQKSRKAETTG